MNSEDRIRERRIELGLSQQELADALGTRQEAISKWEKRGPRRVHNIEQIAEALDCTPWWLIWGVYPKARET